MAKRVTKAQLGNIVYDRVLGEGVFATVLGRSELNIPFPAEEKTLRTQEEHTREYLLLRPFVNANTIPNDHVLRISFVSGTKQDQNDLEIMMYKLGAQLEFTLNHPNIIKCYRACDMFDNSAFLPGTICILPRLGDTLESQLIKGIPLHKAVKAVAQVADVVSYLQKQSIIHRDLKPTNLMFDNGGNCIVADLDAACILNKEKLQKPLYDDDFKNRYAFHGYVEGSFGPLGYMCPDQHKGLENKERRKHDDTFVLGLLAYEVMTGAIAFNDLQVITGRHEVWPCYDNAARDQLMAKLKEKTGEEFSEVIGKALSVTPEERTDPLDIKKLLYGLSQRLERDYPSYTIKRQERY